MLLLTTGTPLSPPPAGKLYHGVYPGGITGEEDDLTEKDLVSYEKLCGQKAVWCYFSHNWFKSRKFPVKTASWIRKHGAVPFIRLMLRSTTEEGKPERLYTLQNIIDGKFDDDLRKWGKAAAEFATPLIVEYGTECNGSWFQWNGKWNGGGEKKKFGSSKKPDGPERFAAAYRHIVSVIRSAGADNITWVFHVDAHDFPEKKWNRFENYYPGNDVVDWIGISAYGPQEPSEKSFESLRQMLDRAYKRAVKLAPEKPIMLLEFGCTVGSSLISPEKWAQEALDDIFAGRWPKLAGFSWWNEKWENDDNPENDTTMRLQDIPALAEVFKKTLSEHKAKLAEIEESSSHPEQHRK